jgi:predicted transcriptional regulator
VILQAGGHGKVYKVKRSENAKYSPVHIVTTMNQAGKTLREKGYKGAPVMDNDKLVGILSRRDFGKIKKKSHFQSPVRAFMSRKIITIHPAESPGHAAHLMIKHDIGRLPVVDEGKIIGIFSRSDAVADLYGLCLLGNNIAAGCRQNRFSLADLGSAKTAGLTVKI